MDGPTTGARQVALELRRLCYGDLAGMFDGPTTPALDLNGPMVVVDLSALEDSEAIALVMVCGGEPLPGTRRQEAAARPARDQQ